ncbi:MAG: DUF366 family protein [Methanobacterium sp.]|nr:DUF366 family protein [Methanobacterium sp.]
MKHLKLENETCYDGSQIEPYWAFKTFGIKDSSIVSWMGPMEIHPDNLIDFEDIGIEIKGDNMLHFIVEHFDSQPADLNLCYHRQRILVLIVKDLLNDWGMVTSREGDDLFFDKVGKRGKLSVSIATCSVSSMKIHFALNLTEKGTPDDVETAALLEAGLNIRTDDVDKIAEIACDKYIQEISSIKSDITKTKVF